MEEKVFQSTAMERAWYDAPRRRLRVRFPNGREYVYGECPPSWWEGLKTAHSPGTFLYGIKPYLRHIPQEERE